MVRIAPYESGRQYDAWLDLSIESITQHIIEKNDDWLVLLVGETGSGKSTLGLHILDKYLQKENSIDFVGFDRSSIAQAIKMAKDKPTLPKAVLLDEANVSKRDSLSQFNKELLDLYLAVRGLNILHLWANPSLDLLDKAFITERIKGVFYVCTKGENGRFYYYYPQSEILKIFEKYGHLKLQLLYKIRGKYAYYRGWFKQYNGPLLEDYLKKKEIRMGEKVEDFFTKWNKTDSKELLSTKEVAKHLGITTASLRNYILDLERENIFQEGVNIVTFPNGLRKFKITLIDDFERIAKTRRENTLRVLDNGRRNN